MSSEHKPSEPAPPPSLPPLLIPTIISTNQPPIEINKPPSPDRMEERTLKMRSAEMPKLSHHQSLPNLKSKSLSEYESGTLKQLSKWFKSITQSKASNVERTASTISLTSSKDEPIASNRSESLKRSSSNRSTRSNHSKLSNRSSNHSKPPNTSVFTQDFHKHPTISNALFTSYAKFPTSVTSSPFPDFHGSASPRLSIYSQSSNGSSLFMNEVEETASAGLPQIKNDDSVSVDLEDLKKLASETQEPDPDSISIDSVIIKPDTDSDSKKSIIFRIRNYFDYSKWSKKKRMVMSFSCFFFTFLTILALSACFEEGAWSKDKKNGGYSDMCDSSTRSSFSFDSEESSMPSFWWSNSIKDKSRIQLFYSASGAWLTSRNDSQSTFSAEQTEPPEVWNSFTVVKSWLFPSRINLKATNGKFFKTLADGTLSATADSVYTATVFVYEQVGSDSIRFRTSKGVYIRPSVSEGGLVRLVRVPRASANETFRVRQGVTVPAIRGVNLGGWLVAEGWMTPKLFENVPEFIDGIQIQFKSVITGLYIYAEEGGGGRITCSSSEPSAWETFYFHLSEFDNDVFQLRTYDRTYLSFNESDGSISALASATRASGSEDFRIYLSPSGTVALVQTHVGTFLSALDDGNLTALGQADLTDLTDENSSIWNSSYAFEVNIVSEVRGEYQLSRALGQASDSVIEKHRLTFIKEKDFAWLADKGINAVRIPVGFWIMDDIYYPFVTNAVIHLDRVFGYAETYNIRIFISIHGAYGSQNGFEHSGSRDGIPDFANDNQNSVNLTLSLVEFISSRYGNHSQFFGIGLLNEPTSYGVPSDVLLDYYTSGYDIVRKYKPCAFVGIDPWIDDFLDEFDDDFMTDASFSNVIYDFHAYQVFDTDKFLNMTVYENIDYVYNQRRERFKSLERGSRLLMVGEWSVALITQNTTSQDYAAFGAAQLEVYGQTSAGWFFWSYKLDRDDYPNWSFRDSLDLGWLQRNSTRLW